MEALWKPEPALEVARTKQVGAACGLVRKPNGKPITDLLYKVFGMPKKVPYEVPEGFCYHPYTQSSLWEDHDQAVLYILEATRTRRATDALDILEKNGERMPLHWKDRFLPILMVTEESHTVKSNYHGARDPEGPDAVAQKAAELGSLVLRTHTTQFKEDLEAALRSLTSGRYPGNLLIPSKLP